MTQSTVEVRCGMAPVTEPSAVLRMFRLQSYLILARASPAESHAGK